MGLPVIPGIRKNGINWVNTYWYYLIHSGEEKIGCTAAKFTNQFVLIALL